MMVADYFAKALQGMIFRKLRDMIMGNTYIALPTDLVHHNADKNTSGIPAVLTHQESRSVLKKKFESGGSPRSLMVLPACVKARMARPLLEILVT
jgi:hypothetical protein